MSGGDMTDLAVLEAARAGDMTAYHRIYTENVESARRVARRIVSSAEDADDVVSEAFAVVLASLRDGKGPTSNVRAYVMTCVRHLSYRFIKRPDIPFTMDDLADAAGVDRAPHGVEVVLDKEERRIVVEAFSGLPENYRRALWAVDVEGKTYADAGVALGLTSGGMGSTVKRAREALRQSFVAVQLEPSSGEHPSNRELAGYARGTLGRRGTPKVEAHLEICARCRLVANEARELGSTLRGLAMPTILLPFVTATGAGVGVVATSTAGGLLAAVIALPGAAIIAIVAGSLLAVGGAASVVLGTGAPAVSAPSLVESETAMPDAGRPAPAAAPGSVVSASPAGVDIAWAAEASVILEDARVDARASGQPQDVDLPFVMRGTAAGAPAQVQVAVILSDGVAAPSSLRGSCSASGDGLSCGPVAVPAPGQSVGGTVRVTVGTGGQGLPKLGVTS